MPFDDCAKHEVSESFISLYYSPAGPKMFKLGIFLQCFLQYFCNVFLTILLQCFNSIFAILFTNILQYSAS